MEFMYWASKNEILISIWMCDMLDYQYVAWLSRFSTQSSLERYLSTRSSDITLEICFHITTFFSPFKFIIFVFIYWSCVYRVSAKKSQPIKLTAWQIIIKSIAIKRNELILLTTTQNSWARCFSAESSLTVGQFTASSLATTSIQNTRDIQLAATQLLLF